MDLIRYIKRQARLARNLARTLTTDTRTAPGGDRWTPASTQEQAMTMHPDANRVLPASWAPADNKWGIPADLPCYEPGPNAPGSHRMNLRYDEGSGWCVEFVGSGRSAFRPSEPNEWFWQGLIEGGIIVDVHNVDVPTIPGDVRREIEAELAGHVPTHDELADKGTGVHAIGWERGFQHALNLVERLGGWRDCKAGTGAALIAVERRHAIEECGFDDAQHTPEDLVTAAYTYLFNGPHLWPFTDGFKPNLPYRRRLIVAGQFIAAAIDRLDADNSDQDARS